MVEIERREKRPSCGWPVPVKVNGIPAGSTQPCGSEDRVFTIKGQGRYTGQTRETPICARHVPDAWKAWKVDSATPL